MHAFYKKIISVLLALSFVFISFPETSKAQLACNFPGCFGGVASVQILCTCSGNFLTWFTPLYIYGSPVPISGPLVYQPGTMKYLNYTILPTQAVIGSYVPGVQACYMYTGTACIPIPNLGFILPDTGSSLPGGGTAGLGGAAIGALGALGAGALSGGGSGGGDSSGAGTGAGVGTGTSTGGSAQSISDASVVYDDRIVITRGGTYTGNWKSNDSRFPAVDIQTSEPVIIKNSNIRSKGTLIKAEGYNANLTIENTRGYGQNPDVNMQVPGRFLSVDRFAKIVVENSYIEGTRGIMILGPKSGAGIIRITKNIAKNIDGRLSGGPGIWRDEDIENYYNKPGIIDTGDLAGTFVQLNQVNKAQVEISWNQVINEPYKSRSEDVISVYKSSGTNFNPISISNNYIFGSYPVNPARDVFTGGGIMSADDTGTSDVWVKNNTVVSTTNYGISASAGSNIKITNNRIISSSRLSDGKMIRYNAGGGNVGIAIFRGYDAPLRNVTASGNTIGWTTARSERNDWYVPEASVFSGNKHYTSRTVAPDGVITRDIEKVEFDMWQTKLQSNAVTIGPVQQ